MEDDRIVCILYIDERKNYLIKSSMISYTRR